MNQQTDCTQPAGPDGDELYATSHAVRRAYEAICDAIIAGKYRPGSHLREVSLAGEIGVSRTPVREALRRLGSEGFVEHRPNQGTFVREWSAESLANIADMRGTLGRAAGEAAALKATAEDIEALAGIADEMSTIMRRRRTSDAAAAAAELAHLTVAFLSFVFATAGNDWMLQTIRQTSDLPTIRRRFQFIEPDEWRRLDFYHREIVTALAAQDAVWSGVVMEAYFRVTKHMSLTAYARARSAIDDNDQEETQA